MVCETTKKRIKGSSQKIRLAFYFYFSNGQQLEQKLTVTSASFSAHSLISSTPRAAIAPFSPTFSAKASTPVFESLPFFACSGGLGLLHIQTFKPLSSMADLSIIESEVLGEHLFASSDPDMSPKPVQGKAPGTPDRKLKPSAESLVSEFKRMEMNGELAPEPLLTPNPHRFVIFPIQHKDVSSPRKGFPQTVRQSLFGTAPWCAALLEMTQTRPPRAP